jgi:hypothetical protein
MDVHLSDEGTVTPSQLKSGLLGSRLLAISLWDDSETRYLAEAMGAATLLDKADLAMELISGIKSTQTREEPLA